MKITLDRLTFTYGLSVELITLSVGVEDAEDRKKLYFLIQRLQTVSVAIVSIVSNISIIYYLFLLEFFCWFLTVI